MLLFSYINCNIDRIKQEVKEGIMPCSILRHWEIYGKYDALKKMGETTTMSVFTVSEKYRISDRLVYQIIKKMENEVSIN